jgi:NAD(P)H-dependent FMN reductase
MRILGISGSLRRGSHNLTLLRAAATQLPPNAVFEEYRELAAIPAYNEDLDTASAPAAVRSLRQAIATADAVIIATPEYNSSVPGALKNALDWASRPWPNNSLRGKPVSVIGASAAVFGAVLAQAELRKILTTIGAHVVDDELPVGQADQAFDRRGQLADPELRDRLAEASRRCSTRRAPQSRHRPVDQPERTREMANPTRAVATKRRLANRSATPNSSRSALLTPVGAVVGGLLSGAVGTAAMDTFLFVRYRLGGGKNSPEEWEFSEDLSGWEDAPAPAQVGKRLVEGLFQVELPPTRAQLVNNVMHWAYGTLQGALYGIVAGSLPKQRVSYGLPFGALVFAGDYVILPAAKLYKPIWEYDAKTLAKDLTGHLVYGLATATAMRLLSANAEQ